MSGTFAGTVGDRLWQLSPIHGNVGPDLDHATHSNESAILSFINQIGQKKGPKHSFDPPKGKEVRRARIDNVSEFQYLLISSLI